MFEPWLKEELICLDLKSLDCKSVFGELLECLPGDVFETKKSAICRQLIQHERFGSCALGFQAAFPHAYIPQIEEPLVIFGLSREGIRFASRDGQKVHFIVLMLLPDWKDFEYVRAEVFRYAFHLFRDESVRERLRLCKGQAEAYQILHCEETCVR